MSGFLHGVFPIEMSNIRPDIVEWDSEDFEPLFDLVIIG